MRIDSPQRDSNLYYTLNLSPIGISNKNLYIPIFAFFHGAKLIKDGEKIVMYNPVLATSMDNESRHDIIGKRLFKFAAKGTHECVHVYNESYITLKHAIYQIDKNMNVNFLYLLVVESDYFMSIKTIYEDLDRSKLMVLLNTDIEKPEHISIKRRFKPFQNIYLQDIDVIYTSNINKWCFGNGLENIKFSNIIDRVNYIENLKIKFNGTI